MIVDKPWGKVATYALNQPSLGPRHHRRARTGDECALPPHAGRDVSCSTRASRSRSATASSKPSRGGVHDPRRGDSPHPLHRIVARASSRSPTDTRWKTTRSASRTSTGVPSSRIGERPGCGAFVDTLGSDAYTSRPEVHNTCVRHAPGLPGARSSVGGDAGLHRSANQRPDPLSPGAPGGGRRPADRGDRHP